MYKCSHCGFTHDGICPRIKSLEYFENGMLKKVEYHDQNEPTDHEMPQYDDDYAENAAMPF
jgi:hypothetical protein